MLGPAFFFAVLGLAGLALPLVQFKPNRIAPGEGIAFVTAFPFGPVLAAGLLLLLALACLTRWSAPVRITLALMGLGIAMLGLGLAASSLSAPASLARVAPASGFWLLVLAFALMLADGVTRLGPAPKASWLILGLTIALVLGLLGSGLMDQVSVMREYATRRAPFLHEARIHLVLAFGSLGLALLIGLPLGVGIYQAIRLRGPVMGVLNVVQTIPSLALFGIMLPFLGWLATIFPGSGISGIGIFPALIALFLYALLPIVSNTLTGLTGVSAATRDAALGLGMTQTQLLGRVLLPLALPSLLAAMRIVLVQNIGLAVIAGLIGGGGFGTFVFQGLNQMAMDLVLLGALPTIALALVAGIVMNLLVRHSQGAQT